MSLELYLLVADKRLQTPTAVGNTSPLPIISPQTWLEIRQYAQTIWLKEPRRAWHLLHVAQEVAARDGQTDLEALITFHLARAANLWVDPQRIHTAVQHAISLFTQTNQPHWIAACQWQSLANPWLSNNFRQAQSTLTTALPLIEAHPDTKSFVQRVHLSLAFVEFLLGLYDSADKRLGQLLNDPETQNSLVQLGQLHFTLAAGRRRQQNYHKAHHHAAQAHTYFTQADASIFTYRSHIQLGYTVLAAHGQYTEAQEHFQTAFDWFQTNGLTNWATQARQGLADVYRQKGQYSVAIEHLREVLSYNEKLKIQGALADILLDLSQLTAEQGLFNLSLDYAQRAYDINAQLEGYAPNRIRAQTAKGVALAHQGHYQHALRELETAYTQAKEQSVHNKDYVKLVVEVSIPLARLWLWLGRPDYAQNYLLIPPQLDTTQLPLPDLLHWYLSQAKLLLELQAFTQVDELLTEGVQRSQEQDLVQFEAQFAQLWGYRYLLTQDYQASQACFQQSQHLFAQIGHVRDELETKIWLSRLWQEQGQKAEAIQQITAVLPYTSDSPRLDWQAKTILAELTQSLDDYEQAIFSLNHIRYQLQRPSLSGPFLSYMDATRLFEQAISSAHQKADEIRLWQFIEASKYKPPIQSALTLISGNALTKIDETTAQLRQQITELTQRISTSKSLRRQREYYAEIKQLSQEYDQWLEQSRRQQLRHLPYLNQIDTITVTQFRQQAEQLWGKNWLAMSYFLSTDAIFISWFTPSTENSKYAPLDKQSHYLIQQVETDPHALTTASWQLLGDLLFPHPLHTLLTADTTLVIIPHANLHHIPWPALHLGEQPLIEISTPLILPSLSTLAHLLAVPPAVEQNQQILVVGVTTFDQHLYPNLPHVQTEVANFPPKQTTSLLNEQATWENLQQVIKGTTPFMAWHLATHAFFDNITNGHMSGFALYDRSIWLEDIEKLAHMPSFIFLSACSSLATHVYEGEELVGLALTFLQQGVKSTIGSLWAIEDEAAHKLTASFYQYWRGTTTAVEALAYAQRQAYLQQEPLAHWAGFRLIGTGHQTPPLPPEEPLSTRPVATSQ